MEGNIVQWDSDKGYGFIEVGGERIFVHCSNIQPRPGKGLDITGQAVEIEEIQTTPKGKKAIGVTRKVRLFAFSTRSTIRTYFRGRASDPGILKDEFKERALRGYAGLYNDADGKEPISPDGFNGFMTEEKLRYLVSSGRGGMKSTRDIRLYVDNYTKYPGDKEVRNYPIEYSPLGLIRHLDGLRDDQCPRCHAILEGEGGLFGSTIHCPKCNWS